jgi:hypothetical protein
MKEKWVCDTSPEEVTLGSIPVFTLADTKEDSPEDFQDNILESTQDHLVWVTLQLDTPQ